MVSANLSWALFWVAVAVFALVEGLLIASLLRSRRPDNSTSAALMRKTFRQDLVWTLAPALLMIVLFAFAFQALQGLYP